MAASGRSGSGGSKGSKGKPALTLRKPGMGVPAVPLDADAFVRGQASGHPDVRATTPAAPLPAARAGDAGGPRNEAPGRSDVQVPAAAPSPAVASVGAAPAPTADQVTEPPSIQTSGPSGTSIEDAVTERRPLVPHDQVTERPDVQPLAPLADPAPTHKLSPPPPWPPVAGQLPLLAASAQPSSRPAAGKGVVVRADGTERRRTTVYLPPALARRLAMHCAAEGVEMSEVATDAIAAWLDARGT